MAGQRSIFEFGEYKPFLNEVAEWRKTGIGERGTRSRMAEAAGCHTAYVSQVLNGSAHFNLEQTEGIARFLELSKDEAAFLFLLVQKDRAGTNSLRAHFNEQLTALASKQLVLKHRLDFQRSLSPDDQAKFYSSWHYGAIHVMVSVPGCQTEKDIAEYLGLPISKVSEIVQFLISVGLVTKTEGSLSIGTSRIHLAHDAAMISKHHTNWRIRAIQSLDMASENDLHYSSVITCSSEDAQKIKMALMRAIDDVRAIVKPSKDENVYAYSIDLFNLAKSGA